MVDNSLMSAPLTHRARSHFQYETRCSISAEARFSSYGCILGSLTFAARRLRSRFARRPAGAQFVIDLAESFLELVNTNGYRNRYHKLAFLELGISRFQQVPTWF